MLKRMVKSLILISSTLRPCKPDSVPIAGEKYLSMPSTLERFPEELKKTSMAFSSEVAAGRVATLSKLLKRDPLKEAFHINRLCGPIAP